MEPLSAADRLLARLRRTRPSAPYVVALDGRSGSGKSTLAAAVAVALADDDPTVAVTVIDGDNFYAGGSAATWDARDAVTKAATVIDWQRQRAVLTALRETGFAEWHPFDWEAPDWDADTVPLCTEPVRCTAGDIVILEGAYSARPELADVVDLRVLLDVAPDVRRARLLAREGEHYRDDWSRRWSAAEDHYFGTIMPPQRFDLVVTT